MKALAIVAHPNIDRSRGNRSLRDAIAQDPNVTVHELCKLCPDFQIDVAREQRRLRDRGNIVLPFPSTGIVSPRF